MSNKFLSLSFLISTASSGLNSMAAVALEDIVKKIKPDISDATSTKVSKLIGIYFQLNVICKSEKLQIYDIFHMEVLHVRNDFLCKSSLVLYSYQF